MPLLPIMLNAFVPIAFVILLGVAAGRIGFMKPEASTVLSTLVLDICLPAELFDAMATMSLHDLPDWRFLAGISAGLLGIFLLALVGALAVFKTGIAAGSLQALNSSFPNIAFIGIPVVLAVIGKSAVIYAVIGIVISSLLLPPIALSLLAAASPAQHGRTGLALVFGSIWGALRQSVVWAPLVGIGFALAHIHLPGFVHGAFTLIGEATTGVALVALGLLLSGQKLHVGTAAIVNVIAKNVAQPAAMALIALLLGMSGEPMRVMILCGALPTAPMTAMFAIKYQVYTEDSDATILISTVLSLVTMGAIIALT